MADQDALERRLTRLRANLPEEEYPQEKDGCFSEETSRHHAGGQHDAGTAKEAGEVNGNIGTEDAAPAGESKQPISPGEASKGKKKTPGVKKSKAQQVRFKRAL